MGTFYARCKVENHKLPKPSAVVPKLCADMGKPLKRLGILRRPWFTALKPRC